MKTFKKYLSNLIGWKTNRKILIIESDDWGSLRMSSIKSFEKLKEKGVPVDIGDSFIYNKFDNLENEDDLDSLFSALKSFKDINGNNLVFTPINLVANPDFEAIKSNHFSGYIYEPFTKTLDKMYGSNNVLNLYRQGIEHNIFVPQFHGREHLNIAVWMNALRSGDPNTLDSFNENFWGYKNNNAFGVMYQAAFDIESPEEITNQHEVLKDGLKLFKEIFGYKASYFVPPNGPINNQLEKTASDNGIKFVSSSKIQNEALGYGKTQKKFHYLGQKNKHRQVYITRNCFFEPSHMGFDWINGCLKDIEIAFYCKKPAVISSHRVNYIGSLDTDNRKKGLMALKMLITKAQEKWPDIEFMTTAQLGNLILKSNLNAE